LHGETGQLLQRAEVLEVGRDCRETAVVEERAQPELDRRTVAQRRVAFTAGEQLGCDVVQVGIGGDEFVDLSRRDRVDRGDQLVDAPSVDLDAEAQLGLGLVAFGDGHEAHVVSEAGELERS